MRLNELHEVPNGHRPTPDELIGEIKPILKKHFIRGKISKSKSSIKVDFGVEFDNLSPAGKKRLAIVDKNVGDADQWSDARFEKKRDVVADDKVHDRYLAALDEILAVLKKLGATSFGYVKPTPGTAGFGGYGTANEFELVAVKSATVTDEWIKYPIFKIEI